MNAAETRVIAEGEGEPGSVAVTAVRKIKGRFIKHDINFLGYRKVFLTVAGRGPWWPALPSWASAA